MKNKFFSKEFWSKKKIIGVSAAGGIAIVAVAVAVPVALTARSTSNGGSDSGTTDEQVQVITRDETQNSEYTQDVIYGTPLSELSKLTPVIPGYKAGKLDEQKTKYTETTDAGSENVFISFVYEPLPKAGLDNTLLELKIKAEVQKKYLPRYEHVVPGLHEISGAYAEWDLYDVGLEKLPEGWLIDKGSARYELGGVGMPLSTGDPPVKVESELAGSVISLDEETSIKVKYSLNPDKNHYGENGVLIVDYSYKPKKYREYATEILPLKFLPAGATPDLLIDEPKGPELVAIGNNLFPESQVNREVGAVNNRNWHLFVSMGYPKKYRDFGFVVRPFLFYDQTFFTERTIEFSVDKYFGHKLLANKPENLEDYGGWSEPEYALTKVVASTANNYDPNYSDKTSKIGFDDLTKLPANSQFSVTYSATSKKTNKKLLYRILVNVLAAVKRLETSYETTIKSTKFGQPVNLTVSKKPDELLGKNAKFDFSAPEWVVGKEGFGETGKFKRGYSLNDAKQVEMLPQGTIIYSAFYADRTNDNLTVDSRDSLIVAYEIEEPEGDQKISIKFNQEISELMAPAKAKFPTPNDKKEPEILTEFSSYKKGLLPGQISYVVLKYESKAPATEPLYKTYQVEVKKQTIADFVQVTEPVFELTSGQMPRQLTAADINLPEGWLLSSGEPEYYLEGSDEELGVFGDLETQIKGLSNHESLIAVYEITADPSRYEPKTATVRVQYIVQPPAPSEVVYMSSTLAFADPLKPVWQVKEAPAAPSGWTYVRSHYSYFIGDDDAETLGSDSDQAALKAEIEGLRFTDFFEVIWTYKDEQNQWMWIVAPYALSGSSKSYYDSVSKLKAAPVTGTKVSFFGEVSKVAVDGTGVTLSNKSATVKTELEVANNFFTVDQPAGTIIEIEYKNSGDTTSSKAKFTVNAKLIEGGFKEGRHQQIKSGQDFAPTPTRLLPANFGQKDNSKQDGNKSEYAFASLQIIGQTAERPGVYNVGFESGDFAGLNGLLKGLPVGTTFTISWTAGEFNDDYVASVDQILVDTYTVVN